MSIDRRTFIGTLGALLMAPKTALALEPTEEGIVGTSFVYPYKRNTSPYSHTYTSFSGADMVLHRKVGPYIMWAGKIAGLSYDETGNGHLILRDVGSLVEFRPDDWYTISINYNDEYGCPVTTTIPWVKLNGPVVYEEVLEFTYDTRPRYTDGTLCASVR